MDVPQYVLWLGPRLSGNSPERQDTVYRVHAPIVVQACQFFQLPAARASSACQRRRPAPAGESDGEHVMPYEILTASLFAPALSRLAGELTFPLPVVPAIGCATWRSAA